MDVLDFRRDVNEKDRKDVYTDSHRHVQLHYSGIYLLTKIGTKYQKRLFYTVGSFLSVNKGFIYFIEINWLV